VAKQILDLYHEILTSECKDLSESAVEVYNNPVFDVLSKGLVVRMIVKFAVNSLVLTSIGTFGNDASKKNIKQMNISFFEASFSTNQK
jgi:hypothetical protein